MPKGLVPKICAHCQAATTVGRNVCGSCKLVRYCTLECQKDHWPIHKALCKFARKAPKPIKAVLQYWASDFSRYLDRIPNEMMNLEMWKKLGVEECTMFTKLLMTGTDPIPGARRKTNIIREVMTIGASGLLSTWNSERPRCFSSEMERVRQLGEELYEETRESDPTYIQWFMDCDMLSFPEWATHELAVVWIDVLTRWRTR